MLRAAFEGHSHRLRLAWLAGALISSVAWSALSCQPGPRAMAIQLPTGMEARFFYDAAFSSDGKMLALAEPGAAVEIWDLIARKRKSLSIPVAGEGAVCSLAYSKGGHFLAVSYGRVITIWELAGGKALVRIPLEGGGSPVAFDDDDTTLLVNLLLPSDDRPGPLGFHSQVARWDVRSGKRLSTVEFEPSHFVEAICPNGRHAVIKVKDAWGIYDLNTRAKVADLNSAHSFAFSGDGSALVSCIKSRLSVLQVPSGKELKRFDMAPPFPDGRSPNLSVSFDGKLLAAGTYPSVNSAGLISLETGKVLDSVECGPWLTMCRYVRLSPGGSMLATMTNGVNVDDQPVPPLFKLWKIPAMR